MSSKEIKAKALQTSMRKANKKYLACYKCRKTVKDVKLSTCSACEHATYCSRECQKAHWPMHKERCKHSSSLRQLMDYTLTPSENNSYNLHKQWRSNPMYIMGTLHTKCQQIMDIQECPPTKIMRAHLEFDYNLKTLLRKNQVLLRNALELHSSEGNNLKRMRFGFTQYALVCNDMGSQYPRFIEMNFEEGCLNIPMEEMIEAENLCKNFLCFQICSMDGMKFMTET